MPELPEVETIRRGLENHLQKKRLHSVKLFRADLRYPFPEGFANALQGQTLQTLNRRAKFLIFDFGGHGFLGHLGMTGSYRIEGGDINYLKHDHFALVFDDFQALYHDPRRFGAVDLFSGDPLSHPWLSHLGIEPLSNDFHGTDLYARLHDRQTPIKSALLNQKIIAGLGNIYVCEALWQSQINPKRPAGRITKRDAENLAKEIRDVLERALRSGGSTLRDYRNAQGETGYFQHEFHVYDREGAPCKACDTPIERITQSGRSTFYCPRCQKR